MISLLTMWLIFRVEHIAVIIKFNVKYRIYVHSKKELLQILYKFNLLILIAQFVPLIFAITLTLMQRLLLVLLILLL